MPYGIFWGGRGQRLEVRVGDVVIHVRFDIIGILLSTIGILYYRYTML